MSTKQIKVRAIDEFVEYEKGNISCEVLVGEEFVANLNEDSQEYYTSDSNGREVFVGEINFKGEIELDECSELVTDAPFGSYAAHQPNYEGFKQLGKLDDYIFQSLAHMGNATHQLSWGLTVLENTEVPRELQQEISNVMNTIRDIQEKLRAHKEE